MEKPIDYSVIAEIEILYRTTIQAKDRPAITSSRVAYEILKSVWNMDTIDLREDFKLMLLNTRNRVIGIVHLSQGGMQGTIVDMRHIFASALKANACGLILAHNHPSGESTPSNEDVMITRKCMEAGRLLDIKVLDHIIIVKDGFRSLMDNGDI
jgi:DNA repair protein RadC